MSTFDLTVLTAEIDLGLDENKQLMEVLVPVILPIGPGQALPLGVVRFALDKSGANKLFAKGTQMASEMTEISRIDVASNMADVEKAASNFDKFKG